MSILAIAAPSFNVASETFIRDHVRWIAPGATVLVCWDGHGVEQFSYPVLSEIDLGLWPPHRPDFLGRMANAIRNRWRTYIVPGLEGKDRRRVRAFFDLHRPTAVLAEFGPTGWALSTVCREASIPLYVHFHGFDANVIGERPIVRQRYRRLFSVATGIIVTTEFMRRRLLSLKCPEDKLILCPCGIDTCAFRPGKQASGVKRILMTSRLVAQKGPLLSMRSFALVLKRHPDAVLEIVGDGPLRNDAEREAREIGVKDRIVFHGAQPHEFVLSRLRTAQVFIQHCVTVPGGGIESQGISILEAMSCGLPVVSTRHGAIVETVEHGVTGLLVDEYDVTGMARAVTELLDNPCRAAVMGAAGRQRILERFTIAQASSRLRTAMGFSQELAT